MSESGDTPLHGRRRRRVIVCLCFVLLAVLLLGAAAAIALLVVLRPRSPTTELLSANVTGVAPRVAMLPAVSVQLNVTFLLVVRVQNPNAAAFRHDAATTLLLYRGAQVGDAVLPAGTIRGRGATTVRFNMTVQADRIVAAAGLAGLLGDVLAGEMEFEARTVVPGHVAILGFKRHVEARSACRIAIGIADLKVRRQDCQNETNL